jgi:hypothetical protein
MARLLINNTIQSLDHLNNRPADKVDHAGTHYWYESGTTVLHNEQGPALIFQSGAKHYYIHGKRHRLECEGPAIEGPSDIEEYFINGKHHRDKDLPAKVDFNGTKFYYQNGVLCRNDDQPSIEFLDGGKVWTRPDGTTRKYYYPALEWEEGTPRPQMYRLNRFSGFKVLDQSNKEVFARISFQNSL